jgi:hypothetical protein
VLTADEMPDDNADLANVEVDFPRLDPDSPAACPVPLTDLLVYLAGEVPDGDSLAATDLTFVRTARVAEAEYWVWRFREPGPQGDDAFATVSRSGQQETLGYEANYYGLSAEQFVLGDYHQVF